MKPKGNGGQRPLAPALPSSSSSLPVADTAASSADARFDALTLHLGHRMEGEIKIGGNYQPWVRHGDTLYLSGQIPRVGDTVMLPGRVGEDLGLAEAQEAAQICALRALALMRQALGSLDRIRQVLRITVCVQCTAEFTQHSEVADGASGVLQAVLGDAGRPTRTSVGVFQLPKNAAVEVDLIAAVVDV